MGIKRISMSLPPERVEQLDQVASFLNISRSSLVVSLVGPALDQMCALLDAYQADTSGESDGRRMQRAAYDRLDQLVEMVEGVRDEADKLQ